jgi:hypothetical protein
MVDGSRMRKEVKAPSTLALCRRSPKWPWARESRGEFGVRREAEAPRRFGLRFWIEQLAECAPLC